MTRRVALILVVGLALVPAAAGCGRYYFSRYRGELAENQQALRELKLGMSSSSVRSLMGDGDVMRYGRIYFVDPWRTESFYLADGTEVLILFYLTQPPRKYYHPDDDELTPIAIENDETVGWGWSYLRRNADRYRLPIPKEQR